MIHSPGEDFCDGDELRSCDEGLVLSPTRKCRERRRCMVVNGAADCVCAPGWTDQGNGCEAPTSCAVANGGCDPLTQCTIQGAQPVCSPCPTGYEGKGETGCFAQLHTLAAPGAVLSPAFTPENHSYRVKLPLLRQSLQLVAETLSDVKLDIDNVAQESGSMWRSQALPLGEHKVQINLTTGIGLKSKYELVVERAGAQEAYLKASAPQSNDEFGAAVAVWGDTLAIGANLEDGSGTNPDDNAVTDSGGVYVFVRKNNQWSQQAHLKSSTPLAGDYFGTSLALYEDTLVVGAPGSNTIASMTPHTGSVNVFKREGTAWKNLTRIVPADSGVQDLFGQSVALDDKHLFVSAPLDNTVQTFGGVVYAYARSGDDFGQPGQLRPMTSIETGLFGWALAVSGESLVIGAPHFNYIRVSDLGPGNAYVFTGSGTQWSQEQMLETPDSLENGATFGWAVAIAGNSLVIGAPRARSSNVGQGPGEAYVYERVAPDSAWKHSLALRAAVPRASDWFGWAVRISEETLLVGSPGDASGSSGFMGDPSRDDVVESGAIFLYGRNKDQWIPTAYIKATHPDMPDNFGGCVAMHGETILSASTGEGSNATGVGGDQTNNSLSRAGAAYVFQ
ncbi:MAG TPA: hypothetical protein VFN67_12690 [Polyangiales bacterium]|nr:hypothetical protein [Polyangiales bacterium]